MPNFLSTPYAYAKRGAELLTELASLREEAEDAAEALEDGTRTDGVASLLRADGSEVPVRTISLTDVELGVIAKVLALTAVTDQDVTRRSLAVSTMESLVRETREA